MLIGRPRPQTICSYGRSDVCRRLLCSLRYKKLLEPPDLPSGKEDMRTSKFLLSIQKTPALKQLVLAQSNVPSQSSRHESETGEGDMQPRDLDLESQACLVKQWNWRGLGENPDSGIGWVGLVRFLPLTEQPCSGCLTSLGHLAFTVKGC